MKATGRNAAGRRYIYQCKRQAGAALVEFAFAGTLALFVIFALIEFGRIVMVQQVLVNASREGCRTAVLASTDDHTAVEATVEQFLERGAVNPATASIAVNPLGLGGLAAGAPITVAVSIPVANVSWGASALFGFVTGSQLSATATMRRE